MTLVPCIACIPWKALHPFHLSIYLSTMFVCLALSLSFSLSLCVCFSLSLSLSLFSSCVYIHTDRKRVCVRELHTHMKLHMYVCPYVYAHTHAHTPYKKNPLTARQESVQRSQSLLAAGFGGRVLLVLSGRFGCLVLRRF